MGAVIYFTEISYQIRIPFKICFFIHQRLIYFLSNQFQTSYKTLWLRVVTECRLNQMKWLMTSQQMRVYHYVFSSSLQTIKFQVKTKVEYELSNLQLYYIYLTIFLARSSEMTCPYQSLLHHHHRLQLYWPISHSLYVQPCWRSWFIN